MSEPSADDPSAVWDAVDGLVRRLDRESALPPEQERLPVTAVSDVRHVHSWQLKASTAGSGKDASFTVHRILAPVHDAAAR
ncbi:hypothetical protein AB0C96_07060 [Streptomyces sp. NPDC048506]|uniref:hypothetical protein n=1 Tax=Streptomyces sp. NPDC048506 TaxID=3155028 RepID=UPI00343EE9C0